MSPLYMSCVQKLVQKKITWNIFSPTGNVMCNEHKHLPTILACFHSTQQCCFNRSRTYNCLILSFICMHTTTVLSSIGVTWCTIMRTVVSCLRDVLPNNGGRVMISCTLFVWQHWQWDPILMSSIDMSYWWHQDQWCHW